MIVDSCIMDTFDNVTGLPVIKYPIFYFSFVVKPKCCNRNPHSNIAHRKYNMILT